MEACLTYTLVTIRRLTLDSQKTGRKKCIAPNGQNWLVWNRFEVGLAVCMTKVQDQKNSYIPNIPSISPFHEVYLVTGQAIPNFDSTETCSMFIHVIMYKGVSTGTFGLRQL